MNSAGVGQGSGPSSGDLWIARDNFRKAHEALRRVEPDSPLLKNPGFEFGATHDIQGYQERTVIMLERTRVMSRRKSLDSHSFNGR